MSDERAMLAFLLNEPVTVVLRDCTFEAVIEHVEIGRKKARALVQRINGEDRKIQRSYCVKPISGYAPYTVSADQLQISSDDDITAEYKEILLKSLVGLH